MTTTPVATKQAVRDLSARLAVEYAGAVPPGRVRAYVSRSEQRLRGVALGYASRLELIETCVRQQLAEATARPPQRTSGLDLCDGQATEDQVSGVAAGRRSAGDDVS